MKKKGIIYSAGILTAANMAIRIAGFTYRVWLTRSIGAEAMGIYHMSVPVISLALTAVSTGLPIAISRAVAREKNNPHPYIKSCLIIECLLSVTIMLIIMLGSSFLSSTFGDIRTQLPLLLLAPSVAFIGIKNAYEGYFIGQGNTVPSAKSEMLDQALRIAFTVTLIKLLSPLSPGFSASIAAAGTTFGEFVSFSVVFLEYRKHRKPSVSKGFRELINVSVPVTGGRLISSAIQSVSALIIPRMLMLSGLTQAQSAKEFGISLGMTFPIIFLPATVFSGLTTVLIPALSCLTKEQARIKIKNALEISSLISFFFATILTMCGPAIGTMLYHEVKAGTYLQFIAPFSALIGINLISSASLNGLGLQKKALINQCIGNIFMLAACIFLTRIPGVRMYGYMLGFGINLLSTSFLNVVTCAKHTKMQIYVSKLILLPVLCGIIAINVTRLINNFINISGTFYMFIIEFTIVIICFIIMAYLTELLRPLMIYIKHKKQ